VSALALGTDRVARAAAALAHFDGGVRAGVQAATQAMTAQLGAPLRDLDPANHVGLAFIDGLHGAEEEASEALGEVAPLLSFVGGSAGDDLRFEETRVHVNGESTAHGAALVALELTVPFTVAKTCSFVPSAHRFVVTKADPATRTVYEVDGVPVLEAYAAATGTTPDRIGNEVFMRHPFGLMFEGEPWIRSPQRALPDGGLRFYCRIEEGMEVHVMEPTNLIEDTRTALRAAEARLGRPAAGALLFNCILRRLELDAQETHAAFRETFGGLPVAGFHTYGETWLGHINQTCTGLIIG
jgi:hypothetical protein